MTTMKTFELDRLTETGDQATLGVFAGNFGSVRYALRPDRRAFLFEQDLGTGLSGGDFLHLPQLETGAAESP